jgi:hypothetical protein
MTNGASKFNTATKCSFNTFPRSDLSLTLLSDPVQTSQSVAIVGGEAFLPCNTTAPGRSHPPLLVIWYKNGGGDPVYR